MAQYTTGIVSSTAGSNVLTFEEDGEGNAPELLANASAGDEIRLGDNPAYFTIASVDSDTQVTLTANYPTTETDETYEIVRDFSANYELPLPNQGDLHFADLMKRALQRIDAVNIGMTNELLLAKSPRVLHVGAAGSDSAGNGAISAPFATISKALETIRLGDEDSLWIVMLSPGAHEWLLTAAECAVVDIGGGAFAYTPTDGQDVVLCGTPGAGLSSVSVTFSGTFTHRLYPRIIGIFDVDLTIDQSSPAPSNVTFGADGYTAPRIANSSITLESDQGGLFRILGAGGRIENSSITQDADTPAAIYVTVGVADGLVVDSNGTFTTAADTDFLDCQIGASAISISGLGTIRDSVFTSAGSIAVTGGMVSNNTLTSSGSSARADGTTLIGNTIEGSTTAQAGSALINIGNTVKGGRAYLSVVGSVTDEAIISGNRFISTDTGYSGPAADCFLRLTSGTACRAIRISDNEFYSARPFSEDPPNTDNGMVAAIIRTGYAGNLVIEGNRYVGKSIFLMNSHSSIDSARNTTDQPVTLIGNILTMDKTGNPDEGPDDINAVVVNYARGEFLSSGNVYRALLADSSKTDAHHACLFFHPQTTAGTQTVRSINDRFEVTLPAGTVTVSGTSTDEKSAIAFFDGSEDRLDAVLVNPSISVDGNEEHVFAGLGSPKVVVIGLVSCNDQVTYQGTAPAGGYQVVRGDLAISDNLTVAKLGSLAGLKAAYRSVSSAATVDPATDFTIMQTGTSISQAVPTTGVATGQIFVFALSRSGSYPRGVTLDPEGAATIGGSSSWTLDYPGSVLIIQFDGTNYQVLSTSGGYTGGISYVDPDTTPRIMQFVDGLLQSDGEI